jgi:hypothetical protein
MRISGKYIILSLPVFSYSDVTLCRGDLGDLQMDDCTLREKALEAIQNGKLPMRSPHSTTGGPGCNEACAICGETVRRTQMELEAEFRQDGESPELHKYHLHPRCFMAWESERSKDGESGQERLPGLQELA